MARLTAPPAPTSKIVKITPAQAETWLGRNSHNRPLRNSTVEGLTAAIQRGEWVLNGDAIRFATNGTLLDGQHRLWAIVESGIPCESLVVTGLEESVQESMDLGARRSLKDVLVLRGETQGTRLAATLTYHWRLVHGQVRMLGAKPTIPQAISHLEKHPGLRDATARADGVRGHLSIAASMLGAFIYEARSIDDDAANEFIDSLQSGASLPATSPIYVLRRHLEKQRLAVGHPGRAALIVDNALLIKAWNAYRNGEMLTKLSWRVSGSNPEPFPEMV